LSYVHPLQSILREPLTGKSLEALVQLKPNLLCLLPRSDLALTHFRSQWSLLKAKLEAEIKDNEAQLKHPSIHPLSFDRIHMYQSARLKFLGELEEIFKNLTSDLGQKGLTLSLQKSFNHTIPMVQPLLGHPQNIFRDWAWPTEENKNYLDFCLEQIKKSNSSPKKILVIAAGAGRLAFDLHQNLGAEYTVSLDNSYFFGQTFHSICWGEGVQLTEFPEPRRRDEEVAVTHKMKAPVKTNEGLYYVLGDLNYLPFAEDSFDLVITPWIIDLIPATLPFLVNNISSLLRTGGQWINFGPFSVSSDIPAGCRWSKKELLGFAEDAGFEVHTNCELHVEYLKSPYSAQVRHETLWGLSFKKVEGSGRKILRLQSPSPWLNDLTIPIPLTSKVQVSQISHHVPERIFSLIDGKRSLQDIAGILSRDFSMNPDEALVSVRQFLLRWSQEN
jgi:hypothetical protein